MKLKQNFIPEALLLNIYLLYIIKQTLFSFEDRLNFVK